MRRSEKDLMYVHVLSECVITVNDACVRTRDAVNQEKSM